MNNFVLDIKILLTKDHHIRQSYYAGGNYGRIIARNRKRGLESPSSIKHY